MKRIFTVLCSLLVLNCLGQQKKNDFKLVNRNLMITRQNGSYIIHLDRANNDGIAWVKGQKFVNGIIEFDVKGKNVIQESFVGVAFHGVNDTTFESIYFRPFNFKADDPGRRAHSVQYMSLPKYDWSQLRQQFPGKYEQPLHTPPDPDAWFHAKIVVKGKMISVYVNGETSASLQVIQILPIKGTMIGFWVGNGSDGDFKDLKILP
ncbi:MAG TPA: hypothetical protein VHA56_04335 [Mucilaginibacter sp.]|nr:hypothetical protein [Mucilaginibacter sp.]